MNEIGFDWEVSDVSDQAIDLKFTFKNPLLVSQESKPDQIICMLNLSAFTDNFGQPLRDQKLSVDVPQQVRTEEEAIAVKESAKTVTTTASSVMGANFFLGIILALSLNQLWSMLNGLQLLTFYLNLGCKLGSIYQFSTKAR